MNDVIPCYPKCFSFPLFSVEHVEPETGDDSRFLEKLNPKIRADVVSELVEKVLECIDTGLTGLRCAHVFGVTSKQWPSSWKKMMENLGMGIIMNYLNFYSIGIYKSYIYIHIYIYIDI